MSYTCPSCMFGTLKPTTVTYMRRWGLYVVTIPDFDAWRCDSCGYTRYDGAALARLEYILGPEDDVAMASPPWRARPSEGPAETGPHRWSF